MGVQRNPVRCDSCGGQHRPGFCSRDGGEAGQRWWIQRFGGQIRRGEDVQAYLRREGMPSGLRDLVASLTPPGE